MEFRKFRIIIFYFLLMVPTLAAGQSDSLRIQLKEMVALFQNHKTEQTYHSAQQLLKKVHKNAPDSVRLEVETLHLLGDCTLELNEFQIALGYYKTAKNKIDDHHLSPVLIAENLNKMGNYYIVVKDYDQAIIHLNDALRLRITNLGREALKTADTYNNLGTCYNFLGDFGKALEFHQQALSIRQQQLPGHHRHIAQSFNNIGLGLESQGDLPNALIAFQKAIEIYTKDNAKHQLDLADVYCNLGNLYGALNDIDQFLLYQTQALDIWSTHLDPNHTLIATAYNNLANGYSMLNLYEKSTDLYHRSLDIRKHIFGKKHPDVATTHYNIGLGHYFADNQDEALKAFYRSLEALNFRFDENPNFDQVNAPNLLLQILTVFIEFHQADFDATDNIESLEEAYYFTHIVDQLIDYLRISYQTEGSKLKLADRSHQFYDNAIHIARTLFQLTKEETYLNRSFQFSEKSKATLLLEALQQTKAEAFAEIPPHIILDIQAMENDIADLDKTLFLSNSLNSNVLIALDSLKQLQFAKKQRLSQLIETIESQYPKYYNLRYNTSTLELSKIQETLLQEDQVLVEYFLGSDFVHIFVVTQEDLRLVSVRLHPEFFEYLDDLFKSIQAFPYISSNGLKANCERYANAAYFLYQHLIRPVEGLLQERVIVIPDGPLGYLPFAALLENYPEDIYNLRQYPYLVHKYAFSYSYSATLLGEMKNQVGRKALTNT